MGLGSNDNGIVDTGNKLMAVLSRDRESVSKFVG
jgi:hypothetical protein